MKAILIIIRNLSKIRASIIWLGLFFCLSISPLPATSSYNLVHKTKYLAFYSPDSLDVAMKKNFDLMDDRIDELQMELSIYVDKRVEVRIVNDHKSYQSLALGKNRIVEFSDAFYSSKEKRIYIRNALEIRESYLKVLMHEYIHWYLENIFTRSPLWFHEGLATQYAGQMGFERYLLFLQHSFFGQQSDLFRMSYTYPKNRSEWDLFYLSSSMAVSYMRQKHEKEWGRFWTIVSDQMLSGQKANFTECFNLAYHRDLFSFHSQFGKHVKSLRIQYLIFSINGLLAMILPFALIIAHVRKRRKMSMLPDLPEPVDDSIDDPEAIDQTPQSTDNT